MDQNVYEKYLKEKEAADLKADELNKSKHKSIYDSLEDPDTW